MTHPFRKRRIVFWAAALSCVGVAAVFFLLQSDWLKESVRRRIVAAVQNATGGQAEIRTFRFHWQVLTAELDGFVLHGTESRTDAPLFRADSVRLRLQIASLLKRDIRIASLQIETPQLHLILRPDGTTNVPGPRQAPLQALTDQLWQLKLQQVRLKNGLLQVNDRRVPLDATAENVDLALFRNGVEPSYALRFASPEMEVCWAKTQKAQGSLKGRAQFAPDQLTLTRAVIHWGDSQAELSGSLRHFAQPVVRWSVQSQLAASQIAAALGMENLKDGTLAVDGSGYRDARTPFAFTGQVDGRRLSYRARTLSLKDLSLKSKLLINGDQIRLPDLDLAGPGFQWKGEGELKDRRRAVLRGLARLDLRTAAAVMGVQNSAWSAAARGSLAMDGILRPQAEDFTVKGDLQLSPADGGLPLSGNLRFTYFQRTHSVKLADSRLGLPNTEISIAGVPGAHLKLSLDSTDLRELQPLYSLVSLPVKGSQFPVLLRDGAAHFNGSIEGPLNNPQIAGALALTNFQAEGANWRNLRSSFDIGKSRLVLSSLDVQQEFLQARAAGEIELKDWRVEGGNALRLGGQFSHLDIERFTQAAGGLAAGTFELSGTVSNPVGNLGIEIANLRWHGEHLESLAATIGLKNGQMQIANGKGKSGGALLNFTGNYEHEPGHWEKGTLWLDLNSSAFPLGSFSALRQRMPDLSAQTELHIKTALLVTPNQVQLRSMDGAIDLRNIAVNQVQYGSLSLRTATHGSIAESALEGSFGASRVSGTAQLQLTPSMPVKAQLQLGRTDLGALAAVLLPAYPRSVFTGSVQGNMTLEGPLEQWEEIRAAIRLEDLQITSPGVKNTNLILRNSAPIILKAANGMVAVESAELSGRDTHLSMNGQVPLLPSRPMRLKVDGNVDLHLAQLFNPNLQSSGDSRISALLGGAPANPTITGTAELHNGNLFLNGFPNGLNDLNGTVRFDRNRATLQKVTARSGGGSIALGGFVTFSAGEPLVYRLEAASQDVRVRYANSLSVTSASQLALTGTSRASVLSGTATVSRIIVNPNADVGALLASTAASEPVGGKPDFLSGLQFDIHVDSAPNLQLSTSLSRDMEATVDLQLRGNPKNPVLLGRVEANEGDIRVFGSRYTINRGQISFVNPAKIDPVLDLDLRTQARGINVDITVSGTLSKLNINYRSDPPLQPRDIIALLTVGRAPSLNPNTPTNAQGANNDISALQSGASTVLGQAVSPNSSRLQKLFGITNIKIDPLVQGITNTSQGRLTLEQQISRQITVTYVTNLSQTSEQIFRLEYALNPQFSLVALRDDNGEFGLDILYKKRFK